MHPTDLILKRTYQIALWLTLLVGLGATAWGVPSAFQHIQEVNAIRHLQHCDHGPHCASTVSATIQGHFTGADTDGNTTYYVRLHLPDGVTSAKNVGNKAYNATKNGDPVTVTVWRDHITAVIIDGMSIDTTGDDEIAAYVATLVGLLGMLSLIATIAIAVTLRARLYISDITDYTPSIGVPLAMHLVAGVLSGAGLLISPYVLYIVLGFAVPAGIIEAFLIKRSLATARAVRSRHDRSVADKV